MPTAEEDDERPEEEIDAPLRDPTASGNSLADVENDTSGRRAKRSATCHITPIDDGYPIVTPTGPWSCAAADVAPPRINVSAQNDSQCGFMPRV
jgi:hypothetical protein